MNNGLGHISILFSRICFHLYILSLLELLLVWAGNIRFLILNGFIHITVCRITLNTTCSTEFLRAIMQMVIFFEIRRLTHW